MLGLRVVRSSGVPYYVRELVPGRAEDSGVAGESPGVWTGGGSAVLGIRGTVGSDEFGAVFAGRDPLGDRALRADRGPRSVAGVELLFGAPKSVSLLHLLGPRELAEASAAAHQEAVAHATGYLERTGLGVRRTRGAVTRRLPATGAVAAGFVHRTSRALDPHLHTHLVVANVAQGLDGIWSSVDTRRMFLHRRGLEAVYEASLRRGLTDRLGVAWERGATGRWDIVGVDPVLARLFSQRTASIDEHTRRATGGRGSPAQRRIAFHVDRPAKDTGPTVDGLRSAWRRRAADHDLDPADLVRVVGRSRTPAGAPAVDADDLVARLGRESVRRETFGTGDLLVAVADSSPGGLAPDDLVAVVDAVARSVASVSGTSGAPDTRQRVARAVGGGPPRQDPRWPAADLVRTLTRRSGALADVLVDPTRSSADPGHDRGRGPPDRQPHAARHPSRVPRPERDIPDRGDLPAGDRANGRGAEPRRALGFDATGPHR